MREEYDFSKSKRAKDVPHLVQLQTEEEGKTRITIMLDNEVIKNFRLRAKQKGLGYQTLINQTLRAFSSTSIVDETLLRKVIREELKNAKA